MILVLGALALPLVRGRLRQLLVVALPVASYAHMLALPADLSVGAELFGYALEPVRVDRLSLVWGHVFHIVAILTAIYALRVKGATEHVAGLTYAGSAIAAAFAGDLITLFVFWELTAVTSVFLIWARPGARSRRAGLRYLVIQVASGVLLLAGSVLTYLERGSLAFDHLGLSGPGSVLIFLAFGIKAAFPLLHNWLQDAYPEATVAGTVFLSAFTTKLAIYALARAFPGTAILIPIGALMTLFPIVYAVIENDLRRVLAYSLNNQLGFMVVGIGIGTELSLNGTAAHAFAHIIYKALLFMAMGAVLHRTGTIKASALGGLYKSMPLTAACCIVGSLSISGFPLFSGFVSKSMILSAGAEAHMLVLSLALLVASAGVVDHSGIKIPFFAFFAHDSGRRVEEAPWNMLLAMGAAAAICIGLGVYPQPLYDLLPYPVSYVPYTTAHVVTSLELLLFAALAFAFLYRSGRYPAEIESVNLDFDWTYRRLAPRAVAAARRRLAALHAAAARRLDAARRRLLRSLERTYGPSGLLGEPWPTGTTALWAAVLLAAYLILSYL